MTGPCRSGPITAAGGPAGGDLLDLRIEVRAGATLQRAGVAVMPLAGPGVLVTALAADSLELRRLLDGTR